MGVPTVIYAGTQIDDGNETTPDVANANTIESVVTEWLGASRNRDAEQ